MKKSSIIASFILLATILVTAFPVDAALFPSPIIPCGTSESGGAPCKICHIYILIKNVIDALLILMVPLAALGIAIGGFWILASQGNPGNVAKGKEIIWNTIWGIVIALAAWILINTIMVTLVKPSASQFLNWNRFPSTCGGS